MDSVQTTVDKAVWRRLGSIMWITVSTVSTTDSMMMMMMMMMMICVFHKFIASCIVLNHLILLHKYGGL